MEWFIITDEVRDLPLPEISSDPNCRNEMLFQFDWSYWNNTLPECPLVRKPHLCHPKPAPSRNELLEVHSACEMEISGITSFPHLQTTWRKVALTLNYDLYFLPWLDSDVAQAKKGREWRRPICQVSGHGRELVKLLRPTRWTRLKFHYLRQSLVVTVIAFSSRTSNVPGMMDCSSWSMRVKIGISET